MTPTLTTPQRTRKSSAARITLLPVLDWLGVGTV
jgi:hypothetical protein